MNGNTGLTHGGSGKPGKTISGRDFGYTSN